MKNIFGLDAYPIFIMWEQLNLNNFLDDMALDESWEHSCLHYGIFLQSEFNKESESEYECIRKYVQSLVQFYIN